MSRNDVYEAVLKPMRTVLSPPQQAAVKPDEALEEYADALRGFDVADLRTAWQHVRDTSTRGFWPSPGALVQASVDARKVRLDSAPKRQVLHGRIVDLEYQPWGGACRCQRCLGKMRGDGFWKAPTEFVSEAEPLRREAAEWLEYQIERLPAASRGETLRAYRLRISNEPDLDLKTVDAQ